jgi:hypothetical protein
LGAAGAKAGLQVIFGKGPDEPVDLLPVGFVGSKPSTGAADRQQGSRLFEPSFQRHLFQTYPPLLHHPLSGAAKLDLTLSLFPLTLAGRLFRIIQLSNITIKISTSSSREMFGEKQT